MIVFAILCIIPTERRTHRAVSRPECARERAGSGDTQEAGKGTGHVRRALNATPKGLGPHCLIM